jgi:hypothetical protein
VTVELDRLKVNPPMLHKVDCAPPRTTPNVQGDIAAKPVIPVKLPSTPNALQKPGFWLTIVRQVFTLVAASRLVLLRATLPEKLIWPVIGMAWTWGTKTPHVSTTAHKDAQSIASLFVGNIFDFMLQVGIAIAVPKEKALFKKCSKYLSVNELTPGVIFRIWCWLPYGIVTFTDGP